MTTTINAVSGNNLQVSADGSGIIQLQSNGKNTNAQAWVNFSGSTVNASYNVGSITVNGTGDFTVNFSNAFPDANYVISGTTGASSGQLACLTQPAGSYPPSTTACRVQTIYVNGSFIGPTNVSIAIFR